MLLAYLFRNFVFLLSIIQLIRTANAATVTTIIQSQESNNLFMIAHSSDIDFNLTGTPGICGNAIIPSSTPNPSAFTYTLAETKPLFCPDKRPPSYFFQVATTLAGQNDTFGSCAVSVVKKAWKADKPSCNTVSSDDVDDDNSVGLFVVLIFGVTASLTSLTLICAFITLTACFYVEYEIIKSLRSQKKSLGDISKSLEESRPQASDYLKKNKSDNPPDYGSTVITNQPQ